MESHCHVLLVEDNPVNQDLGRVMLETFGCKVDVASNGQEALAHARETKFDIIFMDCQMPLMDGLEATRRIRAHENGSALRTPIVALTAHMMEEDIRNCMAAGMDDYLSKPFRMQELSDKVEKWGAGEEPRNDGPPSSPIVPGAVYRSAAHGNGRLDRRSLDNIRALGVNGAKMLEAVIGIYLNDTPILVENLCRAYESSDEKAVTEAAHALKSTSANLGAVVLAELAKNIEDLGKAGAAGNAGGFISQVRTEYEMVREALEGELRRGN